jgi:hypothetical protein
MKMVLLRVGTDTGCKPIHANGPLLPDGSFEYVPLPDCSAANEHRTYGNTIGRFGRPLADYFPERRSRIENFAIHFDPEFETYTYGTPTGLQQSLARLQAGDMLVFYGGLRAVDEEGRPIPQTPHGLYLLGYFEVVCAVRARAYARNELLPDFGENFHVRHEDIFERDHDKLVLVKGGTGSRLLTKAVPISDRRPNKLDRLTFVLSDEMREVFGPLKGAGFIERCSPRWIDPAFVETAADSVRSRP